jgi:glycosyltransferase involved in cell wall biosynthesis
VTSEVAHHVSVIIPTKDHLNDLRRLLTSLDRQTILPAEVIVVDGGTESAEAVTNEEWRFECLHERVVPAGLARQQNAGIRRVRKESTLVGFIDDDMVLDDNALEAMLRFWQDADASIGGAAFNLVNNTDAPRMVWLKGLFGLDGSTRGLMLRSGYQTKIGAVDQTTEVEWLYSGATVWRRSLLDEYSFDEWFQGPSHLYEIEFSVRVSTRYRMFVVADAHSRELPGDRTWNDTPLGRSQIVNRLYFVQKHNGYKGLSVVRCWIALIGQFGVNVGRGIFERNPRYLQRARGNCQGYIDAVRMALRSRGESGTSHFPSGTSNAR